MWEFSREAFRRRPQKPRSRRRVYELYNNVIIIIISFMSPSREFHIIIIIITIIHNRDLSVRGKLIFALV
jgi:hypothetical protein